MDPYEPIRKKYDRRGKILAGFLGVGMLSVVMGGTTIAGDYLSKGASYIAGVEHPENDLAENGLLSILGGVALGVVAGAGMHYTARKRDEELYELFDKVELPDDK